VTHLRAFLAEQQKRRPAVSSQARTTAALKCFFRFLVEEARILRDSALPLRAPKKRAVLPDTLTMGEPERRARTTASRRPLGAALPGQASHTQHTRYDPTRGPGRQALPVAALGDERRPVERRPRLFIGHLQEEQVGELFRVSGRTRARESPANRGP